MMPLSGCPLHCRPVFSTDTPPGSDPAFRRFPTLEDRVLEPRLLFEQRRAQPVREQRELDCGAFEANDDFKAAFCACAAAFHPNDAGVSHYVATILATLDSLGVL
jgi:hypothetical protein